MQDEKINRIINWLDGKKQPPYSIEIRPTYRCNLNCLSCFKHADFYETEKEKNKDELTKIQYIRLIKDASSLGVREILISGGGEPLLRKDIVDIMCEIKKEGMKGELITNGTLFNENSIKRIVSCGWDHIIFSIDGPNKKINDYLRGGKDSFKKNISAIKKFSQFKKELNQEIPKITIATVLSNKNYDQLKKFIKLCKKNNINAFRLQNLIVWSKKGQKLRLKEKDEKKSQKHLKQALKLAKKYKIETNLYEFIKTNFLRNEDTINIINQDNQKNHCFCYAPFHNISISENGRVRYCQMSDVSEENIKQKPLKDVWYGSNLNNLRENLLQKRIPSFCKNCCSPQVFDIIATREKINKLKNED